MLKIHELNFIINQGYEEPEKTSEIKKSVVKVIRTLFVYLSLFLAGNWLRRLRVLDVHLDYFHFVDIIDYIWWGRLRWNDYFWVVVLVNLNVASWWFNFLSVCWLLDLIYIWKHFYIILLLGIHKRRYGSPTYFLLTW